MISNFCLLIRTLKDPHKSLWSLWSFELLSGLNSSPNEPEERQFTLRYDLLDLYVMKQVHSNKTFFNFHTAHSVTNNSSSGSQLRATYTTQCNFHLLFEAVFLCRQILADPIYFWLVSKSPGHHVFCSYKLTLFSLFLYLYLSQNKFENHSREICCLDASSRTKVTFSGFRPVPFD